MLKLVEFDNEAEELKLDELDNDADELKLDELDTAVCNSLILTDEITFNGKSQEESLLKMEN